MATIDWPGKKLTSNSALKDNPQFLFVSDLHYFLRTVHRLSNHLGSQLSSKFPGSQPISFQHEHLEKVKPRDSFYVCEKSDGQRYLMMFTRPPNNPTTQCFLINTKMDIFLLPSIHLAANALNDTLLDGELVLDFAHTDQAALNFYIFDTICIQGTFVGNSVLENRLRLVVGRNVINTPEFCPTPFVSSLLLKKMYLPGACRNLMAQHFAHESDGLIFTSISEVYRAGRTDTILKWKPPEMNTVDFGIGKVANTFGKLFVQDKGKLVDFHQQDFIYLSPEDQELLSQQADQSKLLVLVCECSFDPDWPVAKMNANNELVRDDKAGGGWKFMRFRLDKPLPNHISTVESVIRSIRNPVTREQLFQAVESNNDTKRLKM